MTSKPGTTISTLQEQKQRKHSENFYRLDFSVISMKKSLCSCTLYSQNHFTVTYSNRFFVTLQFEEINVS